MAFLGGGNLRVPGGAGQQGLPLEQWFFETPIVTRCWSTAIVATGIAVQCHIFNPYQLFYSYPTVFDKGQYWRLLSTFLYFGPLSVNLLFHLFFIQRYARMLEEQAPTAAHFGWMIAYATVSLLALSPLFDQPFLGTTLSSMLVYVWSRKNPDMHLNMLGIFTFKAPWLPFVMIGMSVVIHEQWPIDEFFGIGVGHVWYYLNDIYPQLNNNSRPLDPPRWWVRLFDGGMFSGQQDVQPPGLNRDLAAGMVPELH